MHKIEIREYSHPDDPNNFETFYIADILIEDCERIIIKPRSQGNALKRLEKAIEEIKKQEYLMARSSEERRIDGELIRVSIKIKVRPGDAKYSWAVHDQLSIKYNFEVKWIDMAP